jgi:calcium-dependent protein kinase
MKCVDLDGNGSIDYNEFLTATVNREKILSQKNLEMAFQAFDKDGSGKISTDEIMQIFNNTDIKDKSIFEKMIKEADENGDMEISLEEFKNLMTKFFT